MATEFASASGLRATTLGIVADPDYVATTSTERSASRKSETQLQIERHRDATSDAAAAPADG